MTGRISTFVILALSIASARFAVGETAEVLRLTDVIAEVRTNNPEIQAARERARAAAAAPAKASAYDDPTLAYEAWNAPESFNLRDADNNILRLSQKVPFPGKLALAGKIAERDTEVARRDLESTELDVVAAVKRAYYTLWQAHQNLLIYSRDRDLVQQFARITEQKYTVGQVSQPDVLRAQVERTRLINRVTTETLAIDSAGAELAALLSRGASGPLGVPARRGSTRRPKL
jgi:outer membrane protein TolC